ncbi:LacI family DNA-binding transcriptional regulator [Streptomyces sp. NPDC055078]
MATRQPRPGIREVASAAGVSVTTVSHALNNKGRVDIGTRRRIAAVAAELGYRPNRNARSLRSGRTDTIALLLPLQTDRQPRQPIFQIDYYLELTVASVEAAFEHNQALVQLPPLRTLDDLRRFAIDGAVVVDPVYEDPRTGMFAELGLPVVTIGRDLSREDDPWWVAADNARSTRLVLDHLADQGARRVAMLSVDIDWSWFADAEQEYRQWCEERDQEPMLILAPPTKTPETIRTAAARLFDEPRRPDAVLVLPQWLANGIVQGAHLRNLSIPADLLVAVGVDSDQAQSTEPALTAVDLNPKQTAISAVNLLLERIDGARGEGPVSIRPILRARGSTKRGTGRPGKHRPPEPGPSRPH